MSYTHTTKVGRYTLTDGGLSALRKLADGREVLSSDQLRTFEHRAAITVLESVDIEGPELRFARKALDLSQAELAEYLGVSGETVSRWEQGREPFKRSIQVAVSGLLKTSLQDGCLPAPKSTRQVKDFHLDVAIGWK